MKRAMLLVILAGMVGAAAAQPSGMKSISRAELRDKIEGGWAGQMIGVSYGAPTEFRYMEEIIPIDKLPVWTPDRISNSINQDDLYVDMTFAQVLDDQGLDATTEDFGAMFREAKYRLWHANLAARRALKRGVPASLSGTPLHNVHANDIDFQIEADFIGLMAPGMLQSTIEIGERAGKVMNYGDGIYGGIFVGCMYAAGYFETDPRKVVEAGLSCLPPRSPYALLIKDLLAWAKQYPDDWEKNWRLIEEKWNKRDPCPSGALQPFNIDAKINGAYIALGLLYGKGDFEQTIVISTRAGQDSDCNPSSAAGILGVMQGYAAIPDKWKSGIPAIADKKFAYTNYTFRTIVESTEKRAIALAEKTGGRLEGPNLLVKLQKVRPPKLAIWDDFGSPVENIPVTDARFQWKGNWETRERTQRGGVAQSRASSGKNDELSISFNGTGAMLVGPYLAECGTADIYLDGKMVKMVDVCSDEDVDKGGESVYHVFGLKNAQHTIRLVTRGETYGQSKKPAIVIDHLTVFR